MRMIHCLLMNIRISSILMLFLVPSNLFGQNLSIEGNVVNDKGQIIQNYYMQVLNSADSTVLFGKNFNTSKFTLEDIPSREYLLKISCIGYKEVILKVKGNNENHTNLGMVTLIPVTYGITEVVVTAKAPRMVMQHDKVVFNIENTSISNAGTGLDILKRTPYIVTDNNDGITIAGRSNTLVLINGRRIKSNEELRLLNSSQIKNIEIIENPSAKYDAEGHGVINIVTTRIQPIGLYSAIYLKFRQGRRGTSFASSEISYRLKKLRIFGNVSYEHYQSEGLTETWIKYEKENYLFKSYTNDLKRLTKSNNYSYSFGLDYILDANQSLGFQFDGYSNNGNTSCITDMNISRNGINNPLLETLSERNNTPSRNSLAINYNYKDSIGREVSFLSDYTRYSGEDNSNIVESNAIKSYENVMKSLSDLSYDLYSAKLDAVIPLRKNGGKVEFGSKYSFVSSSNDVNFLRCNQDLWNVDPMSNNADYTEKILGIYMLFSKELKRWQYSLGLRYELTKISNHSTLQLSPSYINSDSQFFPNAAVGYTFSKYVICRLAYSRRISRPNYASLNGSVLYIDSLSSRQGNPFLDPTIYNTFSLNFSLFKKITFGITYSYIENPIDMLFINDKSSIERYTVIYKNVKNTWSIGSNMSASLNYGIWKGQPSFSFSYRPVAIVDDGVKYMFYHPMYSFRCSNQLDLVKNLSMDIDALYQQPANSFKKFGKQINLDVGFTKKFLQNRLVCLLSYHGEFKPWTQEHSYSYKYCYIIWNGNDRQSINFSLRYYLTGKSVSTKKKLSSEDELKRM